ncbi:RNA polymerase sigma factor [Pseudomarimonas salicorniae]|uniref:RNA polymerase sigma factor n=1 Tax=Pseudomarimonas salicorniae TaxID=2933270 RepID=A0ABT0GL74_9GAMM|nr:RNA polymerase sigma factor [Lysobacter sp. CAU 1642]
MQAELTSDDIEAARLGDAQALARLLGARRRQVIRYAERHCVVHDVEDAVQETLLIASRSIRRLRAAVALNGWLFRIVKRECDRMKRFWRTHVFDYAPERELEQPVVQPVDALRHDLVRAIESLPQHYRDVVLLRDAQELTIDEICEVLDLSREAAKARLHRARVLLREYLNP